jgi:cell division protein FtsQ
MAKSRAFETQERQAQVLRLNKLGRSALLLLATFLSLAALLLVTADQLYRPDAFVIDQLKIKGKFEHLKPAQIEAVVQQQTIGNFFSVELLEVQQRIEALAWVRQAQVRREWPNTLLVQVSEHRPVMRWQQNKWVTAYGEVLDLPGAVVLQNTMTLSGNEKDAGLILQQAYRWQQTLQESGLELQKVALSGSHSWTLSLHQPLTDSSFDVLLGAEKVAQRLARFQFLFAQQFQQGEQRLNHVDARYPDGLAITASPLASTPLVASE